MAYLSSTMSEISAEKTLRLGTGITKDSLTHIVGVDEALQMGPQMELLAVLCMASPCGLLGFKKQVSHLLFAFSDLVVVEAIDILY